MKKYNLDVKIDTDIYDSELSNKIIETVKKAKKVIDLEKHYRLEVDFDLLSFENDRINSYVIDKPSPCFKDTRKDKIDQMLTQQLNKIQKRLAEIGYDITSSSINGQEFHNLNLIEVRLYENGLKEYDKKGNLKPVIKCNSIIQNAPATMKLMEEVFLEAFKNHVESEERKEIELKSHVPNMIKISNIFNCISNDIISDKKLRKDKNEEQVQHLLNQLISNYKIDSTFPSQFMISGNMKACNSHDNTFDINVDCPEMLIYICMKNGSWVIKQIDDLSDAERLITKDGYNKKEVENIVVIKNLNSLDFILMNKTYSGLIMTDKSRAFECNKLQVCWIQNKA